MSVDARLVTYSTVRDVRIGILAEELASPDTALLQQIQQALDAAGRDFVGRRYQDAITGYKRAATLIWSQIDPGLKLGPGGVWKFAYDPGLLSPLLQASLGWLGVLTVPGPLSPVGPPSPGLVVQSVSPHQIGLTAPAVSSPASLAAAANARLATILASQGSADASTKLQSVANQLDANVARVILSAPGRGFLPLSAPPPAPPPASPPATAPLSPGTPLVARATPLLSDRGALTATNVTAAPESALIASQALQSASAPESAQIASQALQSASMAPVAQIASQTLQSASVVPVALAQQRQLGVVTGTIGVASPQLATFGFTVGSIPDHAAIETQIYASRVSLARLPDVLAQPLVASDLVLSLPHSYYFAIPVGLGDCYAAIGDWANAETYYLQAAAYQYLNTTVEAPQLWAKLANLYVLWADSLYRDGDPASALPIYERVVTQAGAVPAGALYSTAGIDAGAAVARAVIPALPQLIANPTVVAATLNPTIAAPIVDAFVKLGQIKAGLDFYGHWAPAVPIWTFDYLQQVATQFCQLAVTTEQNVISFWDRADQAQLTRLQLAQHVADSQAEVGTAQLQLNAAAAEADAFRKGLDLANLRASDAARNASDYQALHSQSILYQAESSEVSGGDDGDPGRLNSLADQFQSGHTISGDRGDIAAAVQLVSSRLSLQYEVASMQRNAVEMQAAAVQAQAELAAANARVAAASGQVALAQLHASEAQAVLDAFDDATFSAGAWKAMGDRLYRLYRRYLGMALRAAKLMQRAYNFENDATLAVIRSDYSSDEVRGLLAADLLLADVASFTDTLLSTRRTKFQPVTHTLSLATRHSYLFETQFKKTGRIAFDTTADDFDLAFPGTYGGRIRHVEVTVQGLTPTAGISGALTCGGLSFYRTPTDTWTDQDPGHMRRRVQTAETLVISDFDRRSDPLAGSGDGRQTGIFSGAGVIGTWVLDLPPEVNDLDYNLVTDVLVTFTYDARFDPALATAVNQALDSQPGAHSTQLGLPLRWLFPDAFFDLVNKHTATLHVAPSDLPLNHTATALTQVGLLITTAGGHSPAALTIQLTAPGAAAASAAVTDPTGLATSTTTGSPLVSQLGRPVVGDWGLTAALADNPAWTINGALDLTALANATLLLEYSYTPRRTS